MQLQAASFRAYPTQARELAAAHLRLLQQLPESFLPLLLREVIAYDWKFPIERRDLERQLAYLESMSPEKLTTTLKPFADLRLSPELLRQDRVNAPAQFSEQLTAHLWATHQIDTFRSAAVKYIVEFNASAPPASLPTPRLGIVIIGQGVTQNRYRLFRKLRPHGVYLERVKAPRGHEAILEAVGARVEKHPEPYAHWYIDGGASSHAGLTCVSYAALTRVRGLLQSKIQNAFETGMPPETLRTVLAKLRPDEVSMTGADAPLDHFQLSLLTEGSGTQIFSTTFVQWAAREALRRAQPLTLVARFTPRQREKSMRELLGEAQGKPEPDPQGSLIDADMGAYYTWLNQQRLSGAAQARFLVWFEDHGEAVAIAPSLRKGTQSDSPIDLTELLSQLT